MYTISKKAVLILITISVITWSCNIYDNLDHCGIYLEFIFDYNMEFKDTFDKEVETVDVYIFDENGIYIGHKHANSGNDLIGRKQMFLGNEFPTGRYKLITVGGLSNYFRFTDMDGNDFIPGITTVEQVKLSLYRQTNEVSHAFTHLWFGETTEIYNKADLSVWPVHLVRNTNNFHVVLQNRDAGQAQQTEESIPYTFGIVTPEGAAYNFNNKPVIRETVTYYPFYLENEENTEDMLIGKLNTMRLFADDPDGYQLIVQDAKTSGKVWEYDLMTLPNNMNPIRPDGTRLPLQEYLDRQEEWHIIIVYSGVPGEDEGFVALKVIINGWIIWERDIDI